MRLYNLTRWADELPSIAEALRSVGAGFQADELLKGAESAVNCIRGMERAKAQAEAAFEAKRRDPATSVETYATILGRGRHNHVRMVVIRHTKASVWLARDVGDSEGARYSIKTSRMVGASSYTRRHIDWSTTNHAGLLAAREALS